MKTLNSLALFFLFCSGGHGYAFPVTFWVMKQDTSNSKSSKALYEPVKASRSWKICVCLPNPLDQFWWSVNYGLVLAEEFHGANLVIKDAMGYDNLTEQQKQIRDCVDSKADALVIAAVKKTGLEEELALAKSRNIPVIDLVNGMDSEQVTSRSRISSYDLTKAAVTEINKAFAGKKDKAVIGWLPGPKDSSWAKEADRAFHELIDRSLFTIAEGGYGSTTPMEQGDLLRKMDGEKNPPSVIFANAVAAMMAARMVKFNKFQVQIFSYYYTNQIEEFILSGQIKSAPTNFPVYLGFLGIDLAVQALEHRPLPYKVGPMIELVNAGNLSRLKENYLVHPTNYRYLLKPNFR